MAVVAQGTRVFSNGAYILTVHEVKGLHSIEPSTGWPIMPGHVQWSLNNFTAAQRIEIAQFKFNIRSLNSTGAGFSSLIARTFSDISNAQLIFSARDVMSAEAARFDYVPLPAWELDESVLGSPDSQATPHRAINTYHWRRNWIWWLATRIVAFEASASSTNRTALENALLQAINELRTIGDLAWYLNHNRLLWFNYRTAVWTTASGDAPLGGGTRVHNAAAPITWTHLNPIETL